MTRTKVSLAYIENDSERQNTFKRRKKGIMRKAEELSILCGVDTCVIIYSPYDPEPAVWPSQVLEAQRIVGRSINISSTEQTRGMLNQNDFVSRQLTTVNEQVVKQQGEIRYMEMNEVMFECLNGRGFECFIKNMSDVNDLNHVLSQNIRAIGRRVEVLGENHVRG